MPKSLKLLNPNDIDSELTYSACFMLRKIQRTRIGMPEQKSFYSSPAAGYFYESNAQHAHLGGNGVVTSKRTTTGPCVTLLLAVGKSFCIYNINFETVPYLH